MKIDNNYFLRVSVIKDQKEFGIEIPLPVTRLKRTSDCFIQWRDKQYGGAWGINFVSEKDVTRFLELCQVPKKVGENKDFPPSKRKTSKDTSNFRSSNESLNLSRNSTDSLKLSRHSCSSGSLNSVPCPVVNVSTEYLSDSGLQNDHRPKIKKPLVPARKRFGSVNTDSSSSHAVQNHDVPVGFDPLEYEFLMKGNVDENGNNEDLSSSLNFAKSRDCGNVTSSYLDLSLDSKSRVSEDFHHNRPPSAINISRQIMATRKATWLVVKSVLVHSKKGRLELSSHRKWKKYWTVLKGVELIFYHANEKTATSEDFDEASFQLDIDGCIAHPVPEYAQLENVFSLSTKHGNAYYLQATSQADVDNWIHCIHSSAAMAFARRKSVKDDVTETLRKEIHTVNESISSDEKLKKMASLQLKVEKDFQTRQNIMHQICSWEEALEIRYSSLFRTRCYLSAIKGSASPNPQELLSHVSRSTKHALAKIGIFSVTSFHSFVNSRNAVLPPPEEKPKSRLKIKSKGLKARLLTSLKISDENVVSAIRNRHSPNIRRCGMSSSENSDFESNTSSNTPKSRTKTKLRGRIGDTLYVQLPNHVTSDVPYETNLKVLDLLERVCMKEGLDSTDYFVMLLTGDENEHGLLDYTIPKEQTQLEDLLYSSIKLCPKLIYDVTLTTSQDVEEQSFGLRVKKALDERILIIDVHSESSARKFGIMVDDEIIEINSQNLRKMSYSFDDVQEVLRTAHSLTMKLRSKRIADPKKTLQATENMINFLVCPPPPKSMQHEITDDALNALIVPAPNETAANGSHSPSTTRSFDRNSQSEFAVEDIDKFLQTTETVNMMTREMNAHVIKTPSMTRMKPGVKLRKAIVELIDTEKTYVKNLRILLERYLIPMQEEAFLPKDEGDLLVSNVKEIYEFQTSFFEKIKGVVRSEPNFESFAEISELQNVIYLMGETFLEYVDKFKLYSTFCSCHSRTIKLLELNTNESLNAFLLARNPKQQHTCTLESYLITPIQRILRYPLLMKTMLKCMSTDSDEFNCLNDALMRVEEVADYINEMQRISEIYTPLFQQICDQLPGVESSDVVVENMLHYGHVQLLNVAVNEASQRRNSGNIINYRNGGGESLLIFIFKKLVILLSAEDSLSKKRYSPNSSINSRSSGSSRIEAIIPITNLLLRDHAWSDSDKEQVWEIVDAGEGTDGRETVYSFRNRTGEEKKVFVSAIKQSKKINKVSNSVSLLGAKRSTSLSSKSSSSSQPSSVKQKTKKRDSAVYLDTKSENRRSAIPSPIPFRKLGEKFKMKK